ncbi:MAG: histidine triad nucleotide-binding protein [Methylococcales bacterium]|nr:histidine triad nucleotide-binding protein [Methylococcales bacterium]MDD5753582.1 histidine triad nucleotide-binding protein [Methylococcales bacterium]
MSDCLFCKMVAGEITPSVVFEDDEILAFNDIQPQAPIHILIIPKRHIATLNDADDAILLGKLLQVSAQLSKQLNVAETGYRTVINCNAQGGQAVYHLHVHLLAGRQMLWPAG